MSDLLAIGASGVRAYQGALGTVSDNIANAGVDGYSRRTTALAEVAAPTGLTSGSKSTQGYGVRVTGVTRQADEFRAAAVRTAGADLARTAGSAGWLDRIQSALTGNAVGDRVTGFFTAATALAADPSSTAPRAALLEAGTAAADAFSATGSALDGVRDALDAAGDDAATQMTTLAASLAKVNERIGRSPAGSSGAASLADERDRLLEGMSAVADTSVALDANGRATVRIGNGSGPLLVSGTDAAAVTYARTAGGVASFAVHRADGTDIAQPQGGAMAAVVEGASRVGDARAELNGIASDFADAVNAFQAQGQGLDGTAGQPFFAAGATPADLRVVLSDPRGVAAASPGTGPRDAGNLANLSASRSGGGFEARLTDATATNAAALAQRNTVADAQTAIRDSAVAARDQASGVNLDAEAVDLLRFQQAYQASSRVIQVARETFQTILDAGH